MQHAVYHSTPTLAVLALVLFVLVVGIAVGLVLTKHRVKRPLPGKDGHVES